jgi:hypothetical protein
MRRGLRRRSRRGRNWRRRSRVGADGPVYRDGVIPFFLHLIGIVYNRIEDLLAMYTTTVGGIASQTAQEVHRQQRKTEKRGRSNWKPHEYG